MNDLNRTQHYTTNASYITNGLLDFIPPNATLVEPFCGAGDLVALFPNHKWEKYDIEPKTPDTILCDTLLSPQNYREKWVITNPPFLAKNKAKNKFLFTRFPYDDLYKIALSTIMDCEGGIIIIPTNFFADERSGAIRSLFLNQFRIFKMNVFTHPVFTSTTYSVCCFAFRRKNNIAEQQTFSITVEPIHETFSMSIEPQYDYRFAGNYYDDIERVEPIFGRLTTETTTDYITSIRLYAIDTRGTPIHMEYDEEPFYGKSTDRTYATLTSKMLLNEEQQKHLIGLFNQEMAQFRALYHDLPLTNYRDFGRKRIGFDFAYRLASKLVKQII